MCIRDSEALVEVNQRFGSFELDRRNRTATAGGRQHRHDHRAGRERSVCRGRRDRERCVRGGRFGSRSPRLHAHRLRPHARDRLQEGLRGVRYRPTRGHRFSVQAGLRARDLAARGQGQALPRLDHGRRARVDGPQRGDQAVPPLELHVGSAQRGRLYGSNCRLPRHLCRRDSGPRRGRATGHPLRLRFDLSLIHISEPTRPY